MNKLSYILLCVSIVNFAHSNENCAHTYRSFKCVKFISNYDGDTITVSIPGQHELFGKEVSIRLNGIDTPEKRTQNKCEKDLSQIATDYLRYRILKSRSGLIELRDIQRGKYFRIVAEVWVNGRNLNRAMVRRNLAVEYYGDTKRTVDWCKFKPDIPNDMYLFLSRFNKSTN